MKYTKWLYLPVFYMFALWIGCTFKMLGRWMQAYGYGGILYPAGILLFNLVAQLNILFAGLKIDVFSFKTTARSIFTIIFILTSAFLYNIYMTT